MKYISRGFTLIEVLVAVTILSGITVVISQAFLTTTRTNTKTELLKDVKQNGEFAMGQMERMIRQAGSVSSICDTAGTTASSLSLVNADGQTTTLGCVFDGSVTRIASSSGTVTEYLTSSNLTLGGADCSDALMSLEFTCSASSNVPASVNVSYSLRQSGSSPDQFEQASVSFQSRATLRNE